MMWVKFKKDQRDIALEPGTAPFRDETAGAFAELMMKGSLVAAAQPVGGGRLLPIAEREWTPETACAAVATGTVPRRHGSRRDHPHWVFVGTAEAALMARVYAVTDMMYPREEQGTAEELGAIVLGNLSAIAGNKAAMAPEGSARRVLELLLPSLEPTLNAQDQGKLVAAVVPWLTGRFKQDEKAGLGLVRKDFQDEAIGQFGPFMTMRIFEKVWAEALAVEEKKDPKDPAAGTHQPHRHRASPGRRTGRPDARTTATPAA